MLIAATALIISLFATSVPASGWGREGHETVAKLADLNLKNSTRRTVENYLGGHSIVYYAKWCDLIRKTPEFKHTDKWHVSRVDEKLNYVPSEKGDAIYAIETAIETLRDYRNLPDSVVALNIRYLIHFVGDMHCPSHIYYAGRDLRPTVYIEDAGHNYNPFNLHAMWDFALIQANRYMSASEWAEELDQVLAKDRKKAIAGGTPREWLAESAKYCESQFDHVSDGAKLGSDFVIYGMDLIENQISVAGIRLAAILNEIF